MTLAPILPITSLVRNWHDGCRVAQAFVQISSPQIFPQHDSSHDLPPHERLSRTQASYSEQHIARLGPGQAPGHHLSCLPRGDSRALSLACRSSRGVFTEQASASAQPAARAGGIPPCAPEQCCV